MVESNDLEVIPTTTAVDIVIEDNKNNNVETIIEESEILDTTKESTPDVNEQDLEQAKYLLQVIGETEKLLSAASEAENYEDAAIYQEKLEELLPMFEKELVKIKLTEGDVRKLL